MPVARPRRIIQQAGSFFVDASPENPLPPNLLTDPNDHSTANWTRAGMTLSGSQTDRNNGSTAELFMEDTSIFEHSFRQNSITVTAGRIVGIVYYKQYPGSVSTRLIQMNIESGAAGAYINADKNGAVNASGGWSGFTVNAATVSSASNGYYKMTLDIQVGVTSVNMFLASATSASTNFAGDTATGWYIDDHGLYDY